MAIFYVILTLITVSVTAVAQLVVSPGKYSSTDGCVMSIERAANGRTKVRVDKGAAFVSAEFRVPIVSRSGDILSILTCKAAPVTMLDGRSFDGSNVNYSIKENSESVTYRTQCGGAFDAHDIRIYWQVSKVGNYLVGLHTENYIARFSTPSGYHSGPLKTNFYPLSCQQFKKN